VLNFLRPRVLRFPIIALGMVAWFALTNHCALAALEGAAQTPMPSCHESVPAKHAPAKHDHQSTVECCKVLRATLITLSSNQASYDALAFATHTYVVALISAAEQSRLNPVIEWDTGPPDGQSFAESVLQRSVLAHAPPSFA